MFNLFTTKHHINKGTKSSGTPIKTIPAPVSNNIAKSIDRQDALIRDLERQAKTDIMLRFYIKGY